MPPSDKTLGILGVVADLAGLATKIGTSVPGLKKARKRNTSRSAAQEAGRKVQAGAVGGSQTGQGATRGLALREGLRRGSASARENVAASARAADMDEQRFTQERDARNERLATFGNDMTGMAGQVGQGLVDLIAAKEGGTEGVALPGQAEVAGIDPITGLSLQQDPTAQALDAGLQLQEPELGTGVGDQSQTFGLGTGDMGGAPPTTPMEAYQSAMGVDMNALVELAPVMEYKMRVTNMAVQEAERRGVDVSSIIAPLMRQLNIDPETLLNPAGALGDDPGDVLDTVEEGNF